jgi:hypothetical protein
MRIGRLALGLNHTDHASPGAFGQQRDSARRSSMLPWPKST